MFPNKEVLQPTVFDPVSFLVWSEEAFGLWESAWVSLYDTETASGVLLADVSTRVLTIIYNNASLVEFVPYLVVVCVGGLWFIYLFLFLT